MRDQSLMQLRWRLISVLGTVVLAPLCWAWLEQSQSSAAAAVPLPDRAWPVKVSDDRATAAPLRVAAQGRVEPVSEAVELAIGAVGTLAAVYVDEGDTVKQGQLLAELVNGDQVARVSQAEAQVGLRRAELDKLMHGARPEERQQAAAQVAKTMASVALAKLELARR